MPEEEPRIGQGVSGSSPQTSRFSKVAGALGGCGVGSPVGRRGFGARGTSGASKRRPESRRGPGIPGLFP